jgi:hypothetical protein
MMIMMRRGLLPVLAAILLNACAPAGALNEGRDVPAAASLPATTEQGNEQSAGVSDDQSAVLNPGGGAGHGTGDGAEGDVGEALEKGAEQDG